MKQSVLVLMSTYNGDKYLREQIDSILAQDGVDVSLLVLDDGSTDGTLDILTEYKKKEMLSFYSGENLGPQRSFMHLLQNAPESEYYAFADQDDVWLNDKLLCAVNMLRNNDGKPALYFSQTQLVDENLNLRKSVIINPLLTFGESLIYKFIGGCTMVLNNELRLLISDKMPHIMPMHDLWVYSIAMATNAFVVFDHKPHILYRQHGDNVVGQGQGFWYEWKVRLNNFCSKKNERYVQARELFLCYKDEIPYENMKFLKLFLDGKNSFCKRISILRNKNFRCADTTTQILFWINLLLNKY